MKYIKAKYRLSGGPCSEDYDTYGWQSVWAKKTTMIDGEAVDAGSIVGFQPVRAARDGKVLILATPKNIQKLKAMVAKGQMSLAPGESLEAEPISKTEKVEVWPEAPALPSAPDVQEVEVVESTPTPKARRFRKEQAEPDIEA